jgi:hypothetical protein
MPHSASFIAGQFAAALDAEDYDAALALLAEDCLYDAGAFVHTSRLAIIESYRENADDARRRFDEIEYLSAIAATGEHSAVITFVDRLRLGDQWHEHRCRQHIEVNHDGLIMAIMHEELPGQREQLAAFEARPVRPR